MSAVDRVTLGTNAEGAEHIELRDDDPRETVGYEVVIRFYPGSVSEARAFFERLGWPDDQAAWLRFDRIVELGGEDRAVQAYRRRDPNQ